MHGRAWIPFHAAGAKHRTADAKRDAIGGIEKADIAGAADPDTVTGVQVGVFLNAALEILTEALDVFLEGVVGLVLQAADTESVGGKARAAVFFKDLEDFFALAHAIEEGRESADIEGVRAEPEQVAGYALEFGKDGADDPGARRGFDDEKFLDCFAIAQAVADGGNGGHAIEVRSKLSVGAIFGNFFDAAVEISYDALRADDALAIEFEFDAKDAMSGGMLRPHVDDAFTGTEERIGFLRGVFVDCVSQN